MDLDNLKTSRYLRILLAPTGLRRQSAERRNGSNAQATDSAKTIPHAAASPLDRALKTAEVRRAEATADEGAQQAERIRGEAGVAKARAARAYAQAAMEPSCYRPTSI
jgi:uncharacterized membrane protein